MSRPTSPRWAVSDTLVMAQRDLLAIVRTPVTFVFLLVQPIMFVLLFRYVFGGSINVKGPYVNYLIPGILVQTTIFGAIGTAIGNQINVLGLDVVVLGGELLAAENTLYGRICEAAYDAMLPPARRGVSFRLASQKAHSAVVGAAALKWRQIFS